MKKNNNKRSNKNRSESKRSYAAIANARKLSNNIKTPPPVRHSEFLGNVSGSEEFSVTSFPLNPGLIGTFPWLSKQATSWEFYRFKRLSVRYETRSPSTQAGSLIYVVDYRSQDGPPTEEKEAMNSFGAVEGAIWKPLRMPINIKAAKAISPWKQIRSATTAEDLINFDVGRLHVCTTGITGYPSPALLSIGKLYLDLEVEFMTPIQHDPTKVPRMPRCFSRLQTGNLVLPAGKVPVGMAIQNTTGGLVTDEHDGLRLMDHYDSATQRITMPKGHYHISHGSQTTCSGTGPSRHQAEFQKNSTPFGAATSGYSARTIGQAGNSNQINSTKHFNGTETFGLSKWGDAAAGVLTAVGTELLFALL